MKKQLVKSLMFIVLLYSYGSESWDTETCGEKCITAFEFGHRAVCIISARMNTCLDAAMV